MKTLHKIEGFDGHIILYCKYHYKTKVDFLTGLRRIWAIRCGLSEEHVIEGQSDEYIANSLYKLFKILNPSKAEYFHEIIHKEIENDFRYEKLKPIERLILMYRSEIMMIQIREKVKTKYRSIVKLPKPQKLLFKKIIKGKGEYSDYKLVA